MKILLAFMGDIVYYRYNGIYMQKKEKIIMKKPLEGMLVIDLTTFVAAPTAARLLADMGARVIKIEPPKGDAWRANGINQTANKCSATENPIFDLYNNGKDLISLNLKSEDGMTEFVFTLKLADK